MRKCKKNHSSGYSQRCFKGIKERYFCKEIESEVNIVMTQRRNLRMNEKKK